MFQALSHLELTSMTQSVINTMFKKHNFQEESRVEFNLFSSERKN